MNHPLPASILLRLLTANYSHATSTTLKCDTNTGLVALIKTSQIFTAGNCKVDDIAQI